MKLHYQGKYDGHKENLPKREVEGSILIEVNSNKQMEILIKIGVFIALSIITYLRVRNLYWVDLYYGIIYGLILIVVYPFIREMIHALFFREDLYIYTDFVEEYLFLIGTESMSKKKYIMMLLIPDLVLGLIPYITGLIILRLVPLSVLGLFGLTMGMNDYYNVYNVWKQLPIDACVYMSGMDTYWYIP